MISPARLAALRALLSYRKTGRVSLPQADREDDRRLAERVFCGVLQNERFLDFCLAQYITKGYHRLHPAVLDILRLSAYQILLLDRIPVSAAVNDAVSICRSGSYAHHAGLVNAVLRRLAENKDRILTLKPPLSVRYSHPDWMVSRLVERFGREFTEALLSADQDIPALRIQVNTCLCTLNDYVVLLRQSNVEIFQINEELSSVLISSSEVNKLPEYR